MEVLRKIKRKHIGDGQKCCSVTQSCLNLCDPMHCSTPGFPVLYHLLEFAQTHVRWVSDAIQPSHTMLSPSPPAFNLSQHQGLFKWVSYSHLVAKVLEFQLQHQSSNEYSGLISLGLTCWISSQSRGLSRVFSNTTVQKHHFFHAQPSLWSNFHIYTWLLGRSQFLLYQNFVTKVMILLFNMLSSFVIAFLAKSKHLVISCCSHCPQWFWHTRK